jgi:hypothetical protein
MKELPHIATRASKRSQWTTGRLPIIERSASKGVTVACKPAGKRRTGHPITLSPVFRKCAHRRRDGRRIEFAPPNGKTFRSLHDPIRPETERLRARGLPKRSFTLGPAQERTK